MSFSHQRFSGFAVLLAGWIAACGDNATSPTPDPGAPSTALSAGSVAYPVADAGDCTFGAGYWKAHPDAWPARFDPATIFYTSGKSWVDVLNTPPEGDAYYILAHQFIAAGLNLERIDPDLRPDEIGAPWAITGSGYFTDAAHSDHIRSELLNMASLFEGFSEGEQGVRRCS